MVWSDGSPVVNAQLSVIDVTHGKTSLGYGVTADERGQFKINGFASQKLVIEARSNRTYVASANPQQPMERAEKKRITMMRPAETLRIVITKLR